MIGKQITLFFLISLTGFISSSYAMISNNKAWSLVTLSGNYGWFLYSIEPQLRAIEANNPFNQFLANAGGGYQITPHWQLWLGQTLGTTSQDADPGDFEEYRVWEQAIWQHPFYRTTLTSRTRLEQRKSFDYATWANRIRERLLINIPLTTNTALAISNELLVNLNQVQWITTKTWDQNRAYAGIVQQLSKTTSLSVGYMNQWIFSPTVQSDKVLVVNLLIDLPT